MRIRVLMFWLGLACAAAAQEHKISVQRFALPEYPPIAMGAKITGEIRLRLKVAANGEVQSIEVKSGPSMLQKAAVDAIKNWRFHCDDCKYGEPFEHTFTFRFRLGIEEICKYSTNVSKSIPWKFRSTGTNEAFFQFPDAIQVWGIEPCVETAYSQVRGLTPSRNFQ